MSDFCFWVCSDGVLRVTVDNDKNKQLVDCSHLISFYNDEYDFWFKFKNTPIKIEEGTTVLNFLKSIKPFEKFWGKFIGKNISAYIKEVSRPVAIENNKEKQIFDYVQIYWHHYIENEVKTDYPENEDFSDIRKLFNTKYKRYTTSMVNAERYISILGFDNSNEEGYSLSFTNISEFRNAKIYLKDIEQILLSKYTGDQNEESFFNENTKFIKKYHSNEHDYDLYLLEKKAFYTINDLISGFFSSYEYEPQLRDEQKNILENIVSSYKKNNDFDNNNNNKKSNVIDIKSNKEINTEDNKDIKIDFAPGCFDSVINHYEEIDKFWNKVLQTNENKVIKIIPNEAKNEINDISGKLNLIKKENHSKKPKI